MIPEYLFYNDYDHQDENTVVDISDFVEQKVNAGAKYVSQFGPGCLKYKPELTEAELRNEGADTQARSMKDGKAFEGFRYYRGLPDALGK